MATLEASVVARTAGKPEADFSSDLTFADFDDDGKTAAMVNVRHYPEQTISQRDVRSFSATDLHAYDVEAHVRVLDTARSLTLTVSSREDHATLLDPIVSYVISTLRR